MLNMAQQAVRFVLRQHANAVHIRVQTVGQHKIDDAKLAAEVNSRFCTIFSQGV